MRLSASVRLLTLGIAMLSSRRTWAYRPFDQTDADVLERHELELELGPVALQRSSENLVLVAPALVVNYGIFPRLELVLEGKNERSLRSNPDGRWRPQELAVSVKGLARRGSLQGEKGPSLALEPSLLLPGRDQGGVGGQVGVIASVLGSVGALHLNLVPGFSRSHAVAGVVALIAEGPNRWTVRPVAEAQVYGEVRAGSGASLLGGLIVRAGEAWSLDAALRVAQAAGITTLELRAGLTCSFGT